MTKFYSFLSNGITSALELNGSIEWLTFPRFDSPAVFCKILDKEKGGSFEVKPLDEVLLIQRNYMGNSLVLKTVFITRVGKLELIDFLPIGLTALIRIYNSDIPFRVIINPVFNYGLINSSIEEVENGIIYRNPLSKEALELLIKGRYSRENHYGLIFQPGRGYLYLLYSRDIKYGLFSGKGIVYSKPEEALNRAISYWESRVNKARKVREFKDIYERSLLVLLGLIYSPSGGLIASPTTSLPEVIGSQRNWDYRYVWVRDASYSAEALIKAGLVVYARNILSFLLSVIDPSSKSFDHPLYAVDGSPPPAEESLNWLSGFMNSYPVRIGNAAYLQIQMDIEGAFMNALSEYYFMTEDKEYLDDNWFAIESIADWVKSSWREKSTDIWEERDTLEHFVHTKVMSWVALDRASKIAYSLGYKREGDEWKGMAEEIRNDVMMNGYSEELNSFVRFYGCKEVDSSLLMLPIYGFIEATDWKFVKTLEKIERELIVSDRFFLRYKNDFLGKAIYPFTLISTWMARVKIRMGEIEGAKKVINSLVNCSTDLLLLGEHLDPHSCEPRGNFPHAFPHSGLVLSIIELEDMQNGYLNRR